MDDDLQPITNMDNDSKPDIELVGDVSPALQMAEEFMPSTQMDIGEQEFRQLSKDFHTNDMKMQIKRLPKTEIFAFFREKVKPKLKSFGFTGALAALELSLYIADVIQTFSSNSTSLARAAALTSIVPILGCGVDMLAKAEALVFETSDTVICFVADALTFTPLMPLGLLLHMGRYLFQGELRFDSAGDAISYRDKIWAGRIESAYSELYTSASLQWDLEISYLLYQAANVKAQIRTVLMNQTNASSGDRKYYYRKVNVQLCRLVVQRYEELIKEMPQNLLNTFQKDARDFNKYFIETITSTMSEMPRNYQPELVCSERLGCLLYSDEERARDWQARVGNITRQLDANPPPVRSLQFIKRSVAVALSRRFNDVPCSHAQPKLEEHQDTISNFLEEHNISQSKDEVYQDAISNFLEEHEM